MDIYKKKSLKFSGLGRDIRVAELNAARGSSRLQRFSLLRPIDDVPNEDPKEIAPNDENPKENVPTSRIPTFGNQKPQMLTRAEMLKKWKNEKLLKKKIELQSKKPAFKVGLALKLEPNISSFDKLGKFGSLSRIQGSDISSRLQLSKVTNADAKGIKKIAYPVVPKPAIQKTTVPKLAVMKPAIQKTTEPKPALIKPAIQKTTEPKPTMIKPAIQKTTISKPAVIKPAIQKTLSKPAVIKPAIQKASVPKPAVNKPAIQKPAVPSRVPPWKQISNIKPKGSIPASHSNPQTSTTTKPKVPTSANLTNLQNQPSKLNKPGLKNYNPFIKPANPAQVKQPGTAFRKPDKNVILGGKIQPKEIAKKDSALESYDSRFQCQLSLIEPVEAEKSFAPKGFVFQPPTGLQASWSMDEDGPCAIFTRLKNEMEEKIRTSTPKRLEWNECQDQKDSSYTLESSKVPTTSEKRRSGSIPSSETKYIECLLDNSPSEIKLPMTISPQNELLEQEQASKTLALKENHEEIHTKVSFLENQQLELISPDIPVPLEIMHPHLNALKTDMFKPEQSCIASPIVSSDTKDSEIISAEMDPKKEKAILCHKETLEICLPVPNETKGCTSALGLPKDDPMKSPVLCLPGQSTASDICLLELDQAKNTASENFEKSGKKFTQSYRRIEKPSLFKISESPENREMSASRRKKANACAEFTPRRSMRLAQLNKSRSEENLFDVRPLFSSPCKESSKLTYDFENLLLESSRDVSEEPRMCTRSSSADNRKASLLYTPPRRRATRNKSLWGDLMTFSPNV